jgi:hypothetical protein
MGQFEANHGVFNEKLAKRLPFVSKLECFFETDSGISDGLNDNSPSAASGQRWLKPGHTFRG